MNSQLSLSPTGREEVYVYVGELERGREGGMRWGGAWKGRGRETDTRRLD